MEDTALPMGRTNDESWCLGINVRMLCHSSSEQDEQDVQDVQDLQPLSISATYLFYYYACQVIYTFSLRKLLTVHLSQP